MLHHRTGVQRIARRCAEELALKIQTASNRDPVSRNCSKQKTFSVRSTEEPSMKNQFSLFAALLFAAAGAASAQVPSQDVPNAANPTSSPPAASDESKTGRTGRLPAAAMPDTNAPSAEVTGQTRATSEKMEPEMDSVGAGKTAPGAEKK
jgi:hypothetical protein